MKNKPLMHFSVDKKNKKINVDRSFKTPLAQVWAAWTQSELLDRWWAPHPWKAVTKSMDFRVGGSWLYAMIGPENETHWSRADYQSIETQKSFSGLDGFCDENGTLNPKLPRSLWKVTFSEANTGTTMVHIINEFDKLEDLEATIQMGFEEGFTAGLENLDALLASE